MTYLSGIAKFDIDFSESEVNEFYDGFEDGFEDYSDDDFQLCWEAEKNAPWVCIGNQEKHTILKGSIAFFIEWDSTANGYWWQSVESNLVCWSFSETLWDDLQNYVNEFWFE